MFALNSLIGCSIFEMGALSRDAGVTKLDSPDIVWRIGRESKLGPTCQFFGGQFRG
jgi:hypothetical protein